MSCVRSAVAFVPPTFSWQPPCPSTLPRLRPTSHASLLHSALLPPVDASTAVESALLGTPERGRSSYSGVGNPSSGAGALSRGVHAWLFSPAAADVRALVERPTPPSPDGFAATSSSISSASLSLSDGGGAATRAAKPPTGAEVELLQKALAAFYGADRDFESAVDLLTETIRVWERQPPDEKAALYRVRADSLMGLMKPEEAAKDYSVAVKYLEGPGGEKADPEERTAARLGRARAIRSLGIKATKEQAKQASEDYRTYFRLMAGDDVAGDDKTIADGISRNPYAAWEWGMVRRAAGDFRGAAESHLLASRAFDDIGDGPRRVISALDAGIDLAAASSSPEDAALAKDALRPAIDGTTSAAGSDVELLQRVVAKEGEARLALAGVMWESNERSGAEKEYGEACARLDELNVDYQTREKDRIKKGRMLPPEVQRLGFSIDDIVGAEEASCSRFKNEKFLDDRLGWPSPLQAKVTKFLNLDRKIE